MQTINMSHLEPLQSDL